MSFIANAHRMMSTRFMWGKGDLLKKY